MANTHTTPASVASRLTYEEIERLAQIIEDSDIVGQDVKIVAVLRDYVRLRKLANVLYARIKEYRDEHQDEVIVFGDIECLLADAEKGEASGESEVRGE